MDSNQIRIAIISPEKSAYSATFIKAHIDLLDADVKHLYGIFYPIESADNKYQLKEISHIKKVFFKLRLKRTYKGIFKDPVLVQYFKNETIQLVLCEFGPVGAEIYDVCQFLSIPLIVHFHGYDAYAHSILRRYSRSYKAMFAYANYIVVVSKDMKKQLISLNAPVEKLILNPYGPHDDFFKVQPTFENMSFVAVGRFVEKKAPHLVISAFEEVYKKIPNVKLLMAGDGPLLPECQELVKSLNIEKSVVFLGAITQKEVVNLFSNAYCFVQHSVVACNGDSEGTPVAVLEACAAALPVVATRHAGIQDVILDGKTGFLVNEHDVTGMAACMIQLAQDRNLVKNMGQTGRNRIKEDFTMNKHIAVIDDLIKKAVQ